MAACADVTAWDQVRFDRIGVDAVVELGKSAIQIPGERQAAIFIFLETLEFLDEVELELDRYPGSKLKSDVPVCVGAAVTSSMRNNADGVCLLYPLFRGQGEAV